MLPNVRAQAGAGGSSSVRTPRQQVLEEVGGPFDYDLARAELSLLQQLAKNLQQATKVRTEPSKRPTIGKQGATEHTFASQVAKVGASEAATEAAEVAASGEVALEDLEAFRKEIAREIELRMSQPQDSAAARVASGRAASTPATEPAAATSASAPAAVAPAPAKAAAPGKRPVTAPPPGFKIPGSGMEERLKARAERALARAAGEPAQQQQRAANIRKPKAVGGSTRRGVEPLPVDRPVPPMEPAAAAAGADAASPPTERQVFSRVTAPDVAPVPTRNAPAGPSWHSAPGWTSRCRCRSGGRSGGPSPCGPTGCHVSHSCPARRRRSGTCCVSQHGRLGGRPAMLGQAAAAAARGSRSRCF